MAFRRPKDRKFFLRFLTALLTLMIVMSGCEGNETTAFPDAIEVNDQSISVAEVNSGIETIFNNALYYYEDGQLSQFLNKKLEYELFFIPSTETAALPRVYMIVTNVKHPLSTEQTPLLYKFGIQISKYGLQSDFCEQSYVQQEKENGVSFPEETIYLGQHSMCISQIVQPVYEEMTDQWKKQAETALRLYMDDNNFYSQAEKNLQAGKYQVFIQGFTKSDVDTTVVFVHESGQIYLGEYYFVHSISDKVPADLNKVELVEDIDPQFMAYLDKLRLTAALTMEYQVED